MSEVGTQDEPTEDWAISEEALAEASAHEGEPGKPPPEPADPSAEPKHPRGNTAGRDAVVIKALVRDTEAVKMRVDGHSYPSIAAKLGFGHRGNAQRAVQRRLGRMREDCAEAVAELRQIETTRLDVALAAIMGKVRDGDLQAVDRLLRIQERRAAYEGLDQPRGLKVEVTRELEGFLGRLREEFDDDVYERVLALIAGEYGSEALGHSPMGEEPTPAAGGGTGGEGPPPDPAGE